MTPADCVRRVVLAYEQAARKESGSKFLVTVMPKEGSKSWANCEEVYEWCGDHQVELHKYFDLAFEQFDPEWCAKQFKRSWPPFGIASSVKVLLRVEAAFNRPSPMKAERKRIVEDVARMILQHPEGNWGMILENVYGYLPMEIRSEIRRVLNQGGIENG